MNNARAIAWLVFAVALAAAGHVLLDMRGGAPALMRRAALAPHADEARSVTVRRAGGPAVVLESSSGTWRMERPFRSAADQGAVMRLLDALAFSPVQDSMDDAELAKLGRRRRDFGLDAPRVVVEASWQGGASTVSFGVSTPSGDGVYAAVDGAAAVFVAGTNAFAAADLSADGFRSHELFSMPIEEVAAFDIKTRTGPFMRLVRDGDSWRMSEPQSTTVSAQRVKAFLEALLGARAGTFAWPDGSSDGAGEDTVSVARLAGYGLDPESATTVTLKGTDGADRLLSLGKAADKGFVYALVHNGGAVATVEESLADLVSSAPGRLADTRLFPCDEAEVSSVSISDGEDKCLVAKGADGQWILDAPMSAAADQAAAAALVSRLMALRSADLDPSGVLVSVNTNMPAACVSREAVFAGGRVEDLRSREILRIDPSHVRRIVSMPSGGSPTSLVYDADRRAWSVESSPDAGASVDADAVQALLAALNPLSAERVVKLRVGASELGRYGLEIPSHTIAVDRFQEGSVRRNLRIGDASGGGRYATPGSSDAVFVLAPEALRALTAPLVRK